MNQIEKWSEIAGYEGIYEISTNGNIHSVTRNIGNRWGTVTLVHGKALKPKVDDGGYLVIGLCKDGKKTFFSIHRLVALTFIVNPEDKKTVNHKDGDKKNNNMCNLEWATQIEQMAHARQLDLIIPRGEHKYSPEFKLTVLNYLEDKQCSIKELASVFDISERTAGRIAAGKIVKHVRKLTSEDIPAIKELRLQGYTLSKIANTFNCSISQIHRIVNNLSHVVQYER